MTTKYIFSGNRFREKILIVSGIHGDEGDIIPYLKIFLEQKTKEFPFLFIPELSDTALQKKTRENDLNQDLNRNFFDDSQNHEISSVMETINKFEPYSLAISFHEDLEFSETYIYDVGEKFYPLNLNQWKKSVIKSGIELLTGWDELDESKPLRSFITDGYSYASSAIDNGMFEYWVVHKKLAKRSLTIEIPHNASPTQKEQLVVNVFKNLIYPALI
ncbi:MAG: hypothetical protein UX64_C0002G0005 [Microgenomates group bacterium GW2011_GWC2_46_7]|nr:MAG: hypothetical protein UX64_C0002G0005 [Microgenomates group bacterium GW2011_GWC2_46_7]